MRYTLIEEKDSVIEIIDTSRASANTRVRALIEDGGTVVGFIDSELPLLRLRAGLERLENKKLEDALDRLYKIKMFVEKI